MRLLNICGCNNAKRKSPGFKLIPYVHLLGGWGVALAVTSNTVYSVRLHQMSAELAATCNCLDFCIYLFFLHKKEQIFMHRLIFWQFLFLKKFKNNWIYLDQRAEWWVASVVTRCVYRFYGCMAQIQVPVNILESDTAKLEYRDLEQFCFVFSNFVRELY